ncbi:N-acetylmuramoyl-L-alanine amidase [Bradyrhizobium sp. AUGA SZCCT0240]|uniref:N-acetylmuramoyl-L-alanine amidase n=1 Tax=unclassified Bradyrhizobium TaxID=2631580 RepID=UPI001BA93897|nr:MULTISPECIES: N-acetylmuramoyl-L-alanine amidase [unclassified Bradyrhizobium]MBR1189715.1 N-acetylmuramoyl-L-alanine amidase [Bradyrhizobium sp. AUGA SZCCT0160]MBR1199019.1 N-acetylmuramoyl-L-alanine amidase [Bradyrhizobium sp. AUGA SZCCT0158]MBR1239648.1 N-acetylmuramoyl-L-alanine amidase [Bradyrhizobium sp. AUGA SZCCT0274]MBR1257559.1 N-acetylmuramoyl-L-alanine amidase [Bradyrhizobium sp. AUGA SZCCT0240]
MANRANHRVLLGCGLLCAAALACANFITPSAAQGPSPGPAAASASNFPVASDARLAGDSKQTRFVLDLDRPIQFRAFALADPYRVVVDIPQVSFKLAAGTGSTGRGLVKAFRYGLVMPGGSRIVFDLTGPAKVAKSYVLEAANDQPPRLVLELEEVDRTAFVQLLAPENRPELRPAIASANAAVGPDDAPAAAKPAQAQDTRPLIVIDPGHGGIDNGTQAGGEMEKNLVLGFGLALRDRIEKSGKYRVVMTRTDDTFIPLNDRVKVARTQSAALFVSIHADALPRREGDAHGATIYTLSDKASDAEAERLAEAENKSDAIGGVNLTDEPTEVADILIDLAQRETRTFSNRFARILMGEMKTTVRMHKHPLKSAGFRVLKAPDVPSVLVELGYVSNKGDLELLMSENWRNKTVGSMAQAIDAFFAKRLATAGPGK